MALLKASARGGVAKNPFKHGDDQTVISMTNEGKSAKEIGEAIDRTVHSVRYRQNWIRNSKLDTKADLKKYHEKRGTL